MFCPALLDFFYIKGSFSLFRSYLKAHFCSDKSGTELRQLAVQIEETFLDIRQTLKLSWLEK